MVTCDCTMLISHNTTSHVRQVVEPGGRVRLLCQADNYYEYCSWRHTNTPYTLNKGVRECHFEWKRKHVSTSTGEIIFLNVRKNICIRARCGGRRVTPRCSTR